jgi:hypothetical protein
VAVPELTPLAAVPDVLAALGFSPTDDDIDSLPPTMQNRMAPTLSKVSRRFRKEAQRIFTPGQYTHRLLIQGGATRLMEAPSQVASVKVFGRAQIDWRAWQEGGPEWVVWAEGGETFGTDGMLSVIGDPPAGAAPTWSVDGQWIHWRDWDFWQLSGKEVEVTYSWDQPVPSDVVAAVADIVARNLVVDPMGAVRQSKLLMSRHFRQEVADWVMSGGTGFTKDDIEQAQSYRYPVPPTIIASISMMDNSPSQAFLSDSSW